MLINGRIWRYNYKNVKGNPFLFSNLYLEGSVSINGRSFSQMKIRYDIFSDEIIIPHDTIVLQLNKEHIDSFSIYWQNRKYNFIKIADNSQWPFTGYIQDVYSGETNFFIKYQKKIDQPGMQNAPDNFYELRQLYIIRKGKYYTVKTRRNILNLLESEESRIKQFIRDNKVHLRMREPESFIPVLRYYDQITQAE
jgi:hypothetical protein